MSKITTKLLDAAKTKAYPIAVELAKGGMNSYDIAYELKKYVETKTRQFYRQQALESTKMSNIMCGIFEVISGEREKSGKGDSKAEHIFFDVLEQNKIPFQFQYKIGNYRVDYLIAGGIVFEGDGPHHQERKQREYDEKRDKYLKKLGYYVIRLPWTVVAQIQDEIVKEIKQLIKELGL